ncbi:PIF1 helicase [Medicago truncatula]|uniref:PIF1 helicase n=1 Tax=Medicago truncatula TaxID=3880 RepID=G7KAI2_MEDTR|nr:PIF1 helicase [Medicago truncatula]
MLLRNIDQNLGLCNGTWLIITKMGTYVLEAEVISGTHVGQKAFIPRSSLTPSDKKIPFDFRQGQSTLNHVGIYLLQPVFSHGQLYVAMSRVTSRKGLKILLLSEDGDDIHTTSNVVYKEVFQNVR